MYKRINRYLAKNNVIDLPFEIGGDNKEKKCCSVIGMIITKLDL